MAKRAPLKPIKMRPRRTLKMQGFVIAGIVEWQFTYRGKYLINATSHRFARRMKEVFEKLGHEVIELEMVNENDSVGQPDSELNSVVRPKDQDGVLGQLATDGEGRSSGEGRPDASDAGPSLSSTHGAEDGSREGD